jgi:hypothetical protein
MTEKLIQKALFRLFNSHEYKFTNTYFFKNESDWLSFLNSGFCYECEIKISRTDFKADFKKEKHSVHQSKSSGKKLFLRKTGRQTTTNVSWNFLREFPELIESWEYSEYGRLDGSVQKVRYHAHISSGIEFYSNENKLIPNKFFYVVPTGLITAGEVPDYAGLIYVDDLGRCKKIKDGKFLHKDKLDVTRLFTKMYHSYERELISKLQNHV